MLVLLSTDNGRMQQRVCGAYAVVNVESMILSRVAPEAQVSRDAPPNSMANMLVGSLTGGRANDKARLALVLRVESVY